MPPSAAAMPQSSPRLHALLSFDRGADALAAGDEVDDATPTPPPSSEDDGLGGASFDFDFDFAFAPPVSASDLAPADDIFPHGRIVPAYPVFDRRLLDLTSSPDAAGDDDDAAAPSEDTYCEWTPRSAPGSPRRDARFPKSASTGGDLSSSASASTSRRWRLRDLVGVTGVRSRSDGKDKFGFLHHHHAAAAAPPSSKTTTKTKKAAAKKGVVTEMDMATAHKLFYSKAGGGAGAGGERRPLQASYLTYRPAFGGFFAIGR